MADAPYLIALALLEQNGERAMPLQGKSLREPLPADGDPGEVGQQQALELLLREQGDRTDVQTLVGLRQNTDAQEYARIHRALHNLSPDGSHTATAGTFARLTSAAGCSGRYPRTPSSDELAKRAFGAGVPFGLEAPK